MNDPYRGPQSGGFDLNQPTIISLLYLVGIITGGLTAIVGVVLAHVWSGEPKAEWERSHYAYLIRTFWFGLIGWVVGWVLIMTFIGAIIGIPLLLAVVVWMAVRSVMSLIAAQKHQPMPNPHTLLI